ncbi:NADH-quinone oxidoreductase subunit C [Streptomyces sp. WMMC905]|uniref:NADH-quinone oxidoreductase subunit C n=1 Tax=Streptomyces sp. WMMC905 TaxID=3404123 RepID=UPI003B94DAA0
MTPVGWLPAGAEELFGSGARAEEAYDVLTVDVPPVEWVGALRTARDRLGCSYFDWLSAVDEPGDGFRVAAHVVALSPVRRLLLRTTVPHVSPVLASAVDVYAGAAWHERETHEMFGVDFRGHPGLDHLLLPDGFEGHPLRKDFVLAARVAKAWPGAKEPGESSAGTGRAGRRRAVLPPGVPDPREWGPLREAPPAAPADAPALPTDADAGAVAEPDDSGDSGDSGRRGPESNRPARRDRTGRPAPGPAPDPPGPKTPGAAGPGTSGTSGAAAPRARRNRSAAGGSASQRAASEARPAGPRRSRRASEGSASRRASAPGPAAPEPGSGNGTGPGTGSGSGTGGSAEERPARPEGEPGARRTPPGGGDAAPPVASDAPWHHAVPAFEENAFEETSGPTDRRRGAPTRDSDAPDGPEAEERVDRPNPADGPESGDPPEAEGRRGPAGRGESDDRSEAEERSGTDDRPEPGGGTR